MAAEHAILAERIGLTEVVARLVGRQRRLHRQHQQREGQPQGPPGTGDPGAAHTLEDGGHGYQRPDDLVAADGAVALAGAGVTTGAGMAALAAASIRKVMSCAISTAMVL